MNTLTRSGNNKMEEQNSIRGGRPSREKGVEESRKKRGRSHPYVKTCPSADQSEGLGGSERRKLQN